MVTNPAIPAAPRGSKSAGKRLWRAVLADFELGEHEMALLRQAVHVADVCEALQGVIDTDGPLKGGRAHPALVELRQQRILLARLVVALRVPMGDEDGKHGRTQYRGLRGVYGLPGVAS